MKSEVLHRAALMATGSSRSVQSAFPVSVALSLAVDSAVRRDEQPAT
jgi:hypothetical protein